MCFELLLAGLPSIPFFSIQILSFKTKKNKMYNNIKKAMKINKNVLSFFTSFYHVRELINTVEIN